MDKLEKKLVKLEKEFARFKNCPVKQARIIKSAESVTRKIEERKINV